MANWPVDVHMLGRIAYNDAMAWQHNAASAVGSEAHPDMVAVLEHPPLYTVGARRRGIGAVEYVRRLEAAVVRTLSSMQLAGRSVKGRPGVWIGHRKISAIGVSIQRGITMHGLALNIDPDLQWFDAIVPCGLHGLGVTSIELETGTAPDTAAITRTVLEAIAHEFNTDLRSDPSYQEPRYAH